MYAFRFSSIICSLGCTRWSLLFHVGNRIHAVQKQLTRPWASELDIISTRGQPASCRARPISVDDSLEDIKWIRGLGGERLPAASYALLPNLKDGKCAIGEGSRLCRLFSIHQRPNMLVPGTWPAPATYHRPFCEHCCPRSLVGRYTIRAAVVCVALVMWAGWRQHTDCVVPSSLLKPGNTPYPYPASEARAPVCPTCRTRLMWPLCSWSRVGGFINTFLCCCLLSADGSLSRVRQQYAVETILM